jgi:hypothetical protein
LRVGARVRLALLGGALCALERQLVLLASGGLGGGALGLVAALVANVGSLPREGGVGAAVVSRACL